MERKMVSPKFPSRNAGEPPLALKREFIFFLLVFALDFDIDSYICCRVCA